MWQTDFIKLAILTSCFKLLFIPAYRSTDFEVHRNWLAITHSLPVNAWYKNIQPDIQAHQDIQTHPQQNLQIDKNPNNLQQNENQTIKNTFKPHSNKEKFSRSQWTLDYPPLFAILELILSQGAYFADAAMLDIENLNYASWQTVTYQRVTVVVTDVLLLIAVYGFAKFFSENSAKKKCKSESPKDTKYDQDNLKTPLTISLLFLTNSTLFFLDHIHFQYNGFLFGLLLISILMIYKNQIATSAFLFSLLLCMKHIFLYIAPVYGLYMLKRYCVSLKDGCLNKGLFLKRFSQLACIVSFVLLSTFLPFILMGQGMDIISRLFPFQRGLSHAYWAPNFWAIYNSVDKFLYTILRFMHKEGFSVDQSDTASMTGGRVQEFNHHVLPSIKPIHTFILSILFMLPPLRLSWKQTEGHVSFTRAAILCAFTSFLFGWHVHEKAILIVTVPLTLLSMHTKEDAGNFLFLHCIANVSIFPLLFGPQEQVIKYALALFSVVLAFTLLINYHGTPSQSQKPFQLPFLTQLESLYLIGLLFLETYTSLVHSFLFKSALPFIPLLLTSLYCSLGVLYSYVTMLFNNLRL